MKVQIGKGSYTLRARDFKAWSLGGEIQSSHPGGISYWLAHGGGGAGNMEPNSRVISHLLALSANQNPPHLNFVRTPSPQGSCCPATHASARHWATRRCCRGRRAPPASSRNTCGTPSGRPCSALVTVATRWRWSKRKGRGGRTPDQKIPVGEFVLILFSSLFFW